MLRPEDSILRECPVGAILREAPQVYECIAAYSFVENGALDPRHESQWLQDGIRIVSAEKSRLQDVKDSQRKSKQDADYTRTVLNGI
jgi:hypothetical protein